jgi:molybdenum cofactor cytidylyltransferase
MIYGLILAAGKGSRMGQNKMLTKLNGKPLVHHVIDAAEHSDLDKLIIITGFESRKVQLSIHKRDYHLPLYSVGKGLTMIENLAYEQGLSSSLQMGLTHAKEAKGVLVLLGDMPFIKPHHINKLLEAFENEEDIITPIQKGEIGNPILWGKAHFPKLFGLSGDKGARALLSSLPSKQIELESNALHIDIDTPEVLSLYQK